MDQTHHHVFARFDQILQAGGAVDELIAAGFPAGEITVLLKENPASVGFASLKGTKVPAGTSTGGKAGLPLEGSYGLMYPGEGPKAGALDTALHSMGVPTDWPHGVLEGKSLLSVEYANEDAHARAESILEATGASEIGAQ